MSDRFELRGVVAPMLTLLVMAGCGGGDGGGASGGGGAGGGAAVENPVDAATAGNIAGSIVFEGDAPSMDVIDMGGEAVCAAKHASTLPAIFPGFGLATMVFDRGAQSRAVEGAEPLRGP